MNQIVHLPLPPHAVTGPGRGLSPAEITHQSQQIQVIYPRSGFCDGSINHLVLHLTKVLSKILPCPNQQPSRHKWRLSVNLLMQHPLWPSAVIVVLLTSSSIIRRVCFVGCQSRIIIVFLCIYPATRICHQLERLTSTRSCCSDGRSDPLHRRRLSVAAGTIGEFELAAASSRC
jgi:hypothetical protein